MLCRRNQRNQVRGRCLGPHLRRRRRHRRHRLALRRRRRRHSQSQSPSRLHWHAKLRRCRYLQIGHPGRPYEQRNRRSRNHGQLLLVWWRSFEGAASIVQWRRGQVRQCKLSLGRRNLGTRLCRRNLGTRHCRLNTRQHQATEGLLGTWLARGELHRAEAKFTASHERDVPKEPVLVEIWHDSNRGDVAVDECPRLDDFDNHVAPACRTCIRKCSESFTCQDPNLNPLTQPAPLGGDGTT